ncbi:hypothetical protein CLAFUW4_20091 [Fulvia fulva]|uniref:uncharacterized protein n=1 Tax=Passalora fulva TaxID=5499 RepID=UPI002852787A|nr:uncharacterized protein CLAFUR5_20091 [Fulvia fulva]KAK4615980.1 hypothetical protein CLAFUR4_20091 [Fulvia fulva]KAK4616372.1 hypothetical protein CLAFUR0_20091 [Fulvia fulva]WMI38874.1 hypothetical protein CLAFUR5_20091 [Fulvia fulva]WPV19256.1 hypothetical protein CLAFUW4_20091 [Fulvia fulva]WPV33899.1 hypothetical protein CLAFUW7_20091 [Fulvia fulva]
MFPQALVPVYLAFSALACNSSGSLPLGNGCSGTSFPRNLYRGSNPCSTLHSNILSSCPTKAPLIMS